MSRSRLRRLARSNAFRVSCASGASLVLIRRNAETLLGIHHDSCDSDGSTPISAKKHIPGNTHSSGCIPIPSTAARSLHTIALRCNLMGQKQISLESIREWHLKNGFYGGVVVRKPEDITKLNEEVSEILHTPSGREIESSSNAERQSTLVAKMLLHSAETATSGTKKLCAETPEIQSEPDLSSSANRPELSSSPKKFVNRPEQPYECQNTLFDRVFDESESNRRECYYLYYDIDPVKGTKLYDVVIRGSMCWSDLFVNLKFRKVYDPEIGLYVHKGFLQKAHMMLDDLLVLLPKPGRAYDTVVSLHGHSLGGALAAIIGMKLAARGFRIGQVTSFGAPKFCTNYCVAEAEGSDLKTASDMKTASGLKPATDHDVSEDARDITASEIKSLERDSQESTQSFPSLNVPSLNVISDSVSVLSGKIGNTLGDSLTTIQSSVGPLTTSLTTTLSSLSMLSDQEVGGNSKDFFHKVDVSDPASFPYINVYDLEDLITFLPIDGPVSYALKGGYIPVGKQVIVFATDEGGDSGASDSEERPSESSDHGGSSDYHSAAASEGQKKKERIAVLYDPSRTRNPSGLRDWFRRSFLLMPVHNPEAHRMQNYVDRLSPG